MGIPVKQNLVASSKYDIKCPNPMEAEYITFHNTAMDASAENEISYMIRNNSQISYHFAIDDKEVIQGIRVDRNAWACGDGKNGTGNRKSISVEVCYSKSGGAKYEKAEELAVKFVAQLLHERNWGVDRVKPHQHWSGKYCPHRVFDTEGWNSIINRIQKELTALNKGKVTQVSAPVASRGYLIKGDTGAAVKNLQELLNKVGYKLSVDGSYGKLTEDAVSDLQEDNRIKVDGIAGQQTMQVLEALVASKNAPKVKDYMENGDKGANVKLLQTQLKELGYKLAVDGIFGDGTEKAVRQFQDDSKIKVDGYAGKNTQAKLKSAIASKAAKEKAAKAKAAAAKKKAEAEAKKLGSDVLGTLVVTTGALNVRAEANFKSRVVKVAKKGDDFKVYHQKNGLYNVGKNQYVSAGSDFVKFTKNPNYGTAKKSKTVRVLAKNLYTYKTANWKDKGLIVKKGEVFTIVKELKVDGAKMLKIKSGLYITANPDLVKIQ